MQIDSGALRALRKDRRLTQGAVAQRSGIATTYLCRLERGRCENPSLKVVERLARAMNLSAPEQLRLAGQVLVEGSAQPQQPAPIVPAPITDKSSDAVVLCFVPEGRLAEILKQLGLAPSKLFMAAA